MSIALCFASQAAYMPLPLPLPRLLAHFKMDPKLFSEDAADDNAKVQPKILNAACKAAICA